MGGELKQVDVLDDLGAAIIGGDLAAGQVVRTEDLETRFGVSRTVIREALKVLESMGLLTSRRRIGVTVAPPPHWNVFDPRVIRWRLAGPDRADQLQSLIQLRGGFEPAAAALAAHHATPEQCGTLTGAVMDMATHARSGDLRAYLRADVQFHRTLLAASGNEMFAALADVVQEVLEGRTHHGLMPTTPEGSAVRAHIDVAHAVQGGDSTGARNHMQAILDEASHALAEH